MKKLRPFLIYIIILLIAIVSLINVIFTFHVFSVSNRNNNDVFSQLTGKASSNEEKIKESEKLINEIVQRVTEIQSEHTTISQPKDGKDGTDGSKGDKGDKGDSVKGEPGEKGDKGDAGATPELRCNTTKNRWEVRYGTDLGWELLNNQTTKCTITREDIIKSFFPG